MNTITLDYRGVLLLAFGSWRGVSEAAGLPPRQSNPSKWRHGVPTRCLDAIMAYPRRPAWLTRQMLERGAVLHVRAADAPPMAAE